MLVPPNIRLDEVGMRLEMLDERALISGQAEEPIFLFDSLGLERGMKGTPPFNEVFLLLEGFAAHAIPALIHALIDIARVINALGKFSDTGLVPSL